MDIAAQRLRNQRLVGPASRSADELVQWLTAVQAQDFAGAKWALGQRLRGRCDADIELCFDRGAILRTHVMRPTWHFVTPADIHWLLALTAPRVKLAMAYYDRKLALDAATFARSNDAMARALQGGRHLTRPQLAHVLADVGIVASGQRLGHLVMRAELDALICSGPRHGKQFTYALLEERAPPSNGNLARDEALATLALRYFQSHGPAMLHDFSWWSGLSISDARLGLESIKAHLSQTVVDDKTYWYDPTAPKPRFARPRIHLLPNYDEHVIAYKDHAASFDPSRPRKRGSPAHFLGHHIITVNGHVSGGFRRSQAKNQVLIETNLFIHLDKQETQALQEATQALSHFLKKPTKLTHR